MSGMTDERPNCDHKFIDSQNCIKCGAPYWCLEEIDRLKDELRDYKGIEEENRNLKELFHSTLDVLVFNFSVAHDRRIRLQVYHAETVELQEEIDRLNLEVDTLTQQEESWEKENRKARELMALWVGTVYADFIYYSEPAGILDGLTDKFRAHLKEYDKPCPTR